jgi:hypothetical protein
MRRVLLLLMTTMLMLTACAAGDTTVAPPPQAEKVTESVGNTEIDQILGQWKDSAQAAMKGDAVKPETIVEEIYTTPASLTDVKKYYNTLTTKGWYPVRKMSVGDTAENPNDTVLLLGYEHGTTALVVGALDATKFGGTGVVVYTLKGTK